MVGYKVFVGAGRYKGRRGGWAIMVRARSQAEAARILRTGPAHIKNFFGASDDPEEIATFDNKPPGTVIVCPIGTRRYEAADPADLLL